MKTDRIAEYVQIGRKDKDWYADCERTFVDIFGRDRLWLVCQLFAATSINTSLKANITLFRKALYEIENNKPVGAYLPNIVNQLERVRRGEPLSGRKINSFARAMSGDKDAVVVDIWLMRAFDIDKRYMRHTGPHKGTDRSGGPTDKQYTNIEAYVRREAAEMGLQARELSSMIWAGVRIDQTGDMNTRYCERLRAAFTNLFNII